MHTHAQIIDVDASNVDQHGFFCYMSKRKSAGYRQKRDWLEQRFAEGMKIKMIHEEEGRLDITISITSSSRERYARLYHDAGADTLEKIAQWEPEELRKMLAEFVNKTKFEGIAPLPKEVNSCVKTARRLPKIIEY